MEAMPEDTPTILLFRRTRPISASPRLLTEHAMENAERLTYQVERGPLK
jgi:hypothetical protein